LRPRRFARLAPYVLTVGAIFLGWQIAIQPVLQRAPVAIAVRMAPTSHEVLRRAAEAELSASRFDNAAVLGRTALSHAPFDVRALRVVGLSVARQGQADRADQILTLAGNWSLRDDPSHAWLVEHRLRQGDYASSFAHADTLARRREDIQPQVFRLFTTAATADPQRALPVIASMLAADTPWRAGYFRYLNSSLEGLQVGATLATMLQKSKSPATNAELQAIYLSLLNNEQVGAVKILRARLNRPPVGTPVVNGEFDDPDTPEPFQWQLIQKAGAAAAVVRDDSGRPGSALRVEYDGYSAAALARQRTFLAPGRYRFRATSRTESGNAAERLAWTMTCASNSRSLMDLTAVPETTQAQNWSSVVDDFAVPTGCESQWLELKGRPLDQRAPMVAWFDRIGVATLDRVAR
jgi:hypothetical protein